MSLQVLFPGIDTSVSTTGGGTLATDTDFEVLALALDAAGLTSTVEGLSDFTLFAPSDEAFANLATATGFAGDTSDASAVFASIAGTLASLDAGGDPIPLLTDILLYHVAPESESLSDLNGSGDVATVQGTPFQVTGGTVVDADTDATNADIVAADVPVDGGTVQVVDQVLLPIDTPVDNADPTLLDVLKESGGAADDDSSDFDLLLTALQATGLDSVVDEDDAALTVFVPNDGAFISLAQDLGYEGEDESGALQTILDLSADVDPDNPLALVTDILTYHVVGSELDSTAVLASETIGTVNGETITVAGATLEDIDADNAVANITATDVAAANGTAHVIDQVLIPAEFEDIDDDTSTPADDDGGLDFFDALAFLGVFGALVLAGGLAF